VHTKAVKGSKQLALDREDEMSKQTAVDRLMELLSRVEEAKDLDQESRLWSQVILAAMDRKKEIGSQILKQAMKRG